MHILENRNLTYLNVPSLRRHAISLEKSERFAQIRQFVEQPGRAIIQYKPDLKELQKELISRHALQFVVQYDVERPDKAGEVQVGQICQFQKWNNFFENSY